MPKSTIKDPRILTRQQFEERCRVAGGGEGSPGKVLVGDAENQSRTWAARGGYPMGLYFWDDRSAGPDQKQGVTAFASRDGSAYIFVASGGEEVARDFANVAALARTTHGAMEMAFGKGTIGPPSPGGPIML